ncbi:PUA-like domain [Pseudocohnilembus persalinus]|uniref:PUA-like domain n=1 Tax=Pseudocohnilembus persalinus TaxID=266149 RepID=A0A0V0R3P7_PSEPJ|nr:PUA-like domain [Pseudocohnilembus persalinus]|eukprot:KRX09126.1 PUA-like domain [Pseudocohnilembus persalinus]
MLKAVDEVGSLSLVSKSQTKGIKGKLSEFSEIFDDIVEDIIPKKSQLQSAKIRAGETRFEIFSVKEDILFFQKDHDEYILPTLKLVHRYPDLLPKMQIDKGGIKFILQGSNVMCPGLTSAGGKIDEKAEVGHPVAIYAEGKQHAMGIGILIMSPEDIKNVNQGHCIQTYHVIGDGLWNFNDLSKGKK